VAGRQWNSSVTSGEQPTSTRDAIDGAVGPLGQPPTFDRKRSAEALLSLEARMCSQIRGNGFELTLWMTLCGREGWLSAD
jgi:hypothetical protein